MIAVLSEWEMSSQQIFATPLPPLPPLPLRSPEELLPAFLQQPLVNVQYGLQLLLQLQQR
jgi:hypothetical protein